MKPNIFKRGSYWWCMGGSACTCGYSPWMAYEVWRLVTS